MFDMTESRGAECEDGGAYLGIGDNLDAEDIGETRPAVITKCTEYQVLPFLIEN